MAKLMLNRPLPPPISELNKTTYAGGAHDVDAEYRAIFRQGYALSGTGIAPERNSLVILGRPVQARTAVLPIFGFGQMLLCFLVLLLC